MGDIKQDDRIHLLGCAVPQEFGWYKDINCIESIDTSKSSNGCFRRYTIQK